MGTRRTATAALAAVLAEYETLVEVGIGARTDVATALLEAGCTVTATDIDPGVLDASVPAAGGLEVVRDDVTDPDLDVYRGADAIYALRCPPELQQPLVDLADAVDAACLFTTLGTDPVVVDATPKSLPGGQTLHVTRD